MQDLSHVCNLHYSSWQCWTLNPQNEARDWTCILMDTSWVCHHWTTIGIPLSIFLYSLWFFQWSISSSVAYCLLQGVCGFCYFFSYRWLLVHSLVVGENIEINSNFLNLPKLDLWPRCDLSWKIFYVNLKRMNILLLWNGMFCKYHISLSGLGCHLRPMFPCWFSVWMICPLM